MGPIPRNTSLDLDSVIARSIERILSAIDDALQVGLVGLRLGGRCGLVVSQKYLTPLFGVGQKMSRGMQCSSW
jgi:hypothetical protein